MCTNRHIYEQIGKTMCKHLQLFKSKQKDTKEENFTLKKRINNPKSYSKLTKVYKSA